MERFNGLIRITEIKSLPDQGGARLPKEEVLLTVPVLPSVEITDTASPATHGGNSTLNRNRKALMVLREFPATDTPQFS